MPTSALALLHPLLSPAKATGSDPPIGPEPRHFSHRIASVDPASKSPILAENQTPQMVWETVDGSDAVGAVETKQRWRCIAICGRLSGVINDAAAIISLNNCNTDSCVTPIKSGRGPQANFSTRNYCAAELIKKKKQADMGEESMARYQIWQRQLNQDIPSHLNVVSLAQTGISQVNAPEMRPLARHTGRSYMAFCLSLLFW